MGKGSGLTILRVVTVLVVVVILGGVYFVFSNLFNTPNRIPPERIAPVKRGEMVKSVVATGKIEAVSQIEIKSKASGIIQFFYVDEGDPVKKGQVLLELDREQLQAAEREAQANVMAKRALLEMTRADLKTADLALDKARDEATSQDEEYARREWERAKQLFAENLVPRAQLDVAEQQYSAEKLRKKVLKKDVLLKESDLYAAQKTVHQAEADLHGAEAAMQRAEENLRNATIRSPIDGIVLKRYLEVGDAVSSILQLGSNATLIMAIGDTSELFFKGNVDESDVGSLRPGLPVRLTVETFRDKSFAGEVQRISPMGQEVDNVTRFEVRARLLSDTDKLRVNMSANAEIILQQHPDVLTIPETALIYDASRKPFVDVIRVEGDQQLVDRKPVKIGIGNGSRVEVLDGLKGDENVVLQ